jgi:hypothetical protein
MPGGVDIRDCTEHDARNLAIVMGERARVSHDDLTPECRKLHTVMRAMRGFECALGLAGAVAAFYRSRRGFLAVGGVAVATEVFNLLPRVALTSGDESKTEVAGRQIGAIIGSVLTWGLAFVFVRKAWPVAAMAALYDATVYFDAAWNAHAELCKYPRARIEPRE